ncbi:hypothetical protein [Nocardia asiatica]|uniref:HoxN/HupN/NixA family nickel/cobalt transporter n=1 Tax=Nocardia asiatica TaxID=209252 RepID=UPI003EDF513F
MAATVVTLHILGWGTLLLFVVPGQYVIEGAVFGVGLGVTAYTLGMRHAFDADHIAAIDNTTRKLVDGSFMSFAYDWAFAQPVRKIYYNLVITGLSVAVALLIGGQEIVSIVAERLEVSSGIVAWIGNLDLGDLGYIIVGLFVLTWAVAIAVWRFAGLERHWREGLAAR